MGRYLIDTNVVSDFFTASLPESGIVFLSNIIDDLPIISIITQIELLCWNTDDNTLSKIKEFIDDCEIADISPNVVAECVHLRRKKKIKLPDAIIAATAIANSLTLITRNTKDFEVITGLSLLNPFEL